MWSTGNKNFSLLNTSIFTPLYFILFFYHLTIFTTGESSPPYVPLDNITLDCGSSSNSNDLSGRAWRADTSSFLVEQNRESIISTAIEPSKGGLYPVPYATARLSSSQFTYSFTVTRGPKFVRLYFYPASYSDKFNISNAFFSVKASRYTLLSNFSAALHGQALELEGFNREFCLNIEDGESLLNITFTPTPGMADAYAFINGIEIISMPDNLYYTAPGKPGFPSVGLVNTMMQIDTNKALELMHRINVGGQTTSPNDDTGMFRTWLEDTRYLTIAKPSALLYNNVTQLKYTDNNSRYAAPDEVYNTARSMGPDMNVNENYNLTWEFPVDSKFNYLVRLFFCEFYPVVNEMGDRVFLIYMDHQIADDQADVISWSGGNSIPVYRDYAVVMESSQGNGKIVNLSIALHPKPEMLTRHVDAILNGIEIFKLSDSDNNLAAPNPDLHLLTPPTAATPSSKSTKSKSNQTAIGAIVGGAVSGFVVLSFLFFFIFRRRLKVKESAKSDEASRLGQFSISSGKTQGSSTLPADICRRFSLAEIKDATNNFDDIFIIGVGGFGNVYKGLINHGATTVAIKRLNPGSQQGAHEFKTEIEMLSQLRYLHLVSLIGYCYEDNEMILVYDYMARGTLRDHLYKTNNPPLPWTQRLEICIGAARGLQYLHSGAKNTIIHRDVKTTNILLDEKWAAKVSDFGLSKIGPNSMSKQHISTVVKGSFGYLDPEYYRLQQLTEKSDVYSFGVVLCEVLSARPPVIRAAGNNASLAEWARQSHSKGKFGDLIDPYLKGKIEPDCLRKFAEVAISCLRDNGMDRPSMSDVVWGLEFALQLQETATKQGELQSEIDNDVEMPLKGSSVDDSSDDLFSSGSGLVIGSRLSGMTLTSSSDEQSFLSNNSENVMSGAVFSEIMNPKGR